MLGGGAADQGPAHSLNPTPHVSPLPSPWTSSAGRESTPQGVGLVHTHTPTTKTPSVSDGAASSGMRGAGLLGPGPGLGLMVDSRG
mmetsp:Transcript_28557/g.51244  ORF Transcript_28557/g.51244 Transcript_28557/m.51244 type:complete len:86 (+) Transcript_28557:135-392(+)